MYMIPQKEIPIPALRPELLSKTFLPIGYALFAGLEKKIIY
jgi:hypothetical protein